MRQIMVANLKHDPKPQVAKPQHPSEPEIVDSPFDRWVRLADDIIAKHKHPEKTDRLAS
jgi:hypothetical protein